MTLFSVAKKNITGNFKSYLIYLISMLFSVVIYYTFVSLQYSKEIQATIESSQRMESIFMMSSIILILFVTVFIWYSNSFFTKNRKKEVGLYSLLGLRKKTIGKMLFYENLIMGAIVLVIGILLGSFLTKLFSMILLKLVDLEVNISFNLSLEAIVNTLIVFTIIIVITSIQGYRLIYRFKLIELFHAEKEGEQVPKASVITAEIAIILLTVSYWFASKPFPNDLTNTYLVTKISIMMGGIVLGTYFLFQSVTVFLLKFIQKNKTYFYRGMNLIGTSQLLYRIKGNARTLTMIALLSAFTLSAISMAYSQYYGTKEHADQSMPFSYIHLSKGNNFDQQIKQMIYADKEHPVTTQLDIPVIKVDVLSTNSNLPDYVSSLVGKLAESLPEEKPVKLISEESFNAVSKALNRKETVELSEHQAVVIKPRSTDETFANYNNRTITVKLPNEEHTFHFVDIVDNPVLAWKYPDFYMIVDDTTFANIATQIEPIVFKAYKVKDQKTTEATSDAILKLDTEENQKSNFFNMYKKDSKISTYYAVYRDGIEGAGLSIFTIGFLGLVFLAATGSIIYFKQLTEANSDKGRYEILKKIGVSKHEIYRSIAGQSLFVFALPLIVGVLHSTMILELLGNMLSNLIGVDLTIPILTSMTAYIIIYLGYYVLTVKTYNNIVNK